MRKSPLSTPGGSGGKQGFRWNAREKSNSLGYGNAKGDNIQCFVPEQGQASPQKGTNDFIPLGFSSPMSQQQGSGGYWRNAGGGRNHRNSMGGGSNNYRNTYQSSPKSSHCSPNSPYKGPNMQHRGQRRSFQTHRQVNISSYVNLQAILENPWADLMKKLDSTELAQGLKNENSSNTTDSSCGSVLLGNLTVKSNSFASDNTDSEILIPESEDSSKTPSIVPKHENLELSS